MTLDLETATAMLSAYTNAELAILDGKTISFNGRTISRENLSEIRAGRQEWERRVQKLQTVANGQTASTASRFKKARF